MENNISIDMSIKKLISIIIPAYNSRNNLEILLNSLSRSSYKDFEIIINDDKRTSDDTSKLIEQIKNEGQIKIIYIKENLSMAQARKRAAFLATGEYLLHLDSDMEVTEDLLDECIGLNQYDALVIPERSIGINYWGRCKAMEKQFYEGIENLESLRFILKDIYFKIGGHDENMVFSEDKDLDIRARNSGTRVGRTQNYIYHNEGSLSLREILKKKKFYTSSAELFAKKYPKEFKWQSNILIRYRIFFKNFKWLFKNPLIYSGMAFMKTCEYIYSGFHYIFRKRKKI